MFLPPLIKKISDDITCHRLCKEGDKILVSVSGGSDSVALLHILLELRDQWKYDLNVLHFDHGIRSESSQECQFVKELSQQHNLPFYVLYNPHLTEESTGIQAKARQWRLAQSEKIRLAIKAAWIATAHHQDDQIETLLLKLLRGCHLSHLRGMAWQKGHYIRPLLNCTKAELQRYLKNKSQPWQEDTSNQSSQYLRNRIRLELIPLMNELARGELYSRLGDLSQQSMQLQDWIVNEKQSIEINSREEGTGFFVKDLVNFPLMVQSEILHEYLTTQEIKNLDYNHLHQILTLLQKDKPQWSLHLPGKKILRREGEKIFIFLPQSTTTQKILCNSIEITSDLGPQWEIRCRLLQTDPVFLSEGLILFNIEPQSSFRLRFREAGDRFHPPWKQKPVKLKDFFRDQGIPLHQRDRIPLICQNENILAIYPDFCNHSICSNEKKFPPLHIHLKFLGVW